MIVDFHLVKSMNIQTWNTTSSYVKCPLSPDIITFFFSKKKHMLHHGNKYFYFSESFEKKMLHCENKISQGPVIK